MLGLLVGEWGWHTFRIFFFELKIWRVLQHYSLLLSNSVKCSKAWAQRRRWLCCFWGIPILIAWCLESNDKRWVLPVAWPRLQMAITCLCILNNPHSVKIYGMQPLFQSLCWILLFSAAALTSTLFKRKDNYIACKSIIYFTHWVCKSI